MKTKNILIAALLAVSVACYIYFVETPASKAKQQQSKPFSLTSKKDLHSLMLKGMNSGEIQLSRTQPVSQSKAFEASGWSLSGKEYSLLDSTILTGVVDQLFLADLGQALPSTEVEADLSLYGLSAPEFTLQAIYDSEAGDAALQFNFGKKSDFIGKRYLQLKRPDGSTDIFMTDDLLFLAANKNELDYRKKEFISFDDSKQRKLIINSALFPSQLVLEKVASNIPGETQEIWKISSPIIASADNEKVVNLLRSLKNIKATRFIEGQELGQIAPLLTNSLINMQLFESAETESKKIAITKKSAEDKETLFAFSEYENTFFGVEDDKFFSEFKDMDAFRRHAFFKFDIFDVQSIRVEASDKNLIADAKKDSEKWKILFGEQGEKDGDPAFVEGYLSALASVSAIAFPEAEDKDFGFTNPRLKVELKLTKFDSSSTFSRILIVGNEVEFEDEEKGYFAAVDDLSEPFIISEKDLLKIQPKPATWAQLATPTPAPTNSGS